MEELFLKLIKTQNKKKTLKTQTQINELKFQLELFY